MENRIINHNTFSIPVVENTINSLQIELEGFATTQGRQDGQKKDEIASHTFDITIKSYIKAKGQEAIDIIRQAVLVAGQVLHIKELEQIAENDRVKKQSIIHDKEHQLVALQRVKKSIIPDPFKLKYSVWLLPLSMFVGSADGTMTYPGLRSASYSTILALIASVAIALSISSSHIFYAPWVMHSKNKLLRILKISVILAVAFLFFFWISNIRAEGINNGINITVPEYGDQIDSSPHISQWAICGISFALFTVILFFSLLVWRSREERLRDAKYLKTCGDINKLESEIRILQKEITDTQNSILIQKRDARIAYDYVKKSIQRTKNICEAAITTYTQNYARYHNTVPNFFTDTPGLQYDENLQLFEPEKHEV